MAIKIGVQQVFSHSRPCVNIPIVKELLITCVSMMLILMFQFVLYVTNAGDLVPDFKSQKQPLNNKRNHSTPSK